MRWNSAIDPNRVLRPRHSESTKRAQDTIPTYPKDFHKEESPQALVLPCGHPFHPACYKAWVAFRRVGKQTRQNRAGTREKERAREKESARARLALSIRSRRPRCSDRPRSIGRVRAVGAR